MLLAGLSVSRPFATMFRATITESIFGGSPFHHASADTSKFTRLVTVCFSVGGQGYVCSIITTWSSWMSAAMPLICLTTWAKRLLHSFLASGVDNFSCAMFVVWYEFGLREWDDERVGLLLYKLDAGNYVHETQHKAHTPPSSSCMYETKVLPWLLNVSDTTSIFSRI